MENNELLKNDNTVLVDADQLQNLITQNKELKELLGASAKLYDFIKNDVFGGAIPNNFNMATILSIGKNALQLNKKATNEPDYFNKIIGSLDIIDKNLNKYL